MGKGIYALVAIIRTEGQVNRMSDDLISRKLLLEEIDLNFIIPILKINMREEHKAVNKIWGIITNMPTAFDKEQVINEIRSGVMAANDEYIETCNEYYHGMQEAHKIDWRIVEKGGIG